MVGKLTVEGADDIEERWRGRESLSEKCFDWQVREGDKRPISHRPGRLKVQLVMYGQPCYLAFLVFGKYEHIMKSYRIIFLENYKQIIWKMVNGICVRLMHQTNEPLWPKWYLTSTAHFTSPAHQSAINTRWYLKPLLKPLCLLCS